MWLKFVSREKEEMKLAACFALVIHSQYVNHATTIVCLFITKHQFVFKKGKESLQIKKKVLNSLSIRF